MTTTPPRPAPPTAPRAVPLTGAGTGNAGSWHGHHLFLHTTAEHVDAFLLDTAAPLLDALVTAGEADGWFFIRYGEDGPHLRIRVHGPAGGAAARLPAELTAAARALPAVPGPWPSAHGESRLVPYEPETDRYGGPRALPIAEDVFVASTRAALGALGELRGRGAAARLTLAADLAQATAWALDLDEPAAARWLRGHAAGWRWVTEVPLLPGASVHARVNAVYAAQRTALRGRAADLRRRLTEGRAAPWLTEWTERVREADARLRAADGPGSTHGWVWASQLHMLLNRLGATPDEERAVCRLAARTLLDAEDEPPTYFPSPRTAPDLRYLERSKFQIGRGQDSALRPTAPLADRPANPNPWQRPGPELALPTGPLPDVTLREALAARVSTRGPLTGPVDAETLGALLWHSLAESARTEQRLPDGTARTLVHRPHPSAGALYTARVRLLVFDVPGVPAGTWECEPGTRTLRRIGPAPDRTAVQALSTYFTRPETDPDRIGVEEVPVLLGVYADLGTLRRRYGLRALRLALLETGHLTQTLLLTAAALDLVGTPLGGFHDDLAHELLGLDDLERPLQYLLPLGRRPR
ncbi:thiopeptide-type bacteriocin biosynthesis protein (plasmid) [Streptomyces sp. BI20]|uniref:thiopeptide-type bacteriocin biosynthesis protein n=1 Tax=Streptomyces sp. BI20 TaxID=3403460 RepID=UPI003C7381E2